MAFGNEETAWIVSGQTCLNRSYLFYWRLEPAVNSPWIAIGSLGHTSRTSCNFLSLFAPDKSVNLFVISWVSGHFLNLLSES